jgi:UDP-galactopyranose mutase
LATYRYYNMDQVVGQALATFARIDETERMRDAGLTIAHGARRASTALLGR